MMQKEAEHKQPPVDEKKPLVGSDSHAETLATDDVTILQNSLFTDAPTVIAEPPDPLATPFPPLVRTHPLTDQSRIAAARQIELYRDLFPL
jgi:hypothetical protein